MADLNEFFTALHMFKQGVSDLQTSRALNTANDVVQQIKQSENDDAKKTSDLRQVAESLTLNLMRYGHPAEAAKAVATTFAPEKQPLLQSFDQAMIYGNDKQKAAAQAGETFQTDEKIRLAQAKQPEPDPFKNAIKAQHAFAAFDKTISPDSQRAGSFGGADKTIKRGQGLMALVGSGRDLNTLTPIEITESASAFAQMVKNGAIPTEAELHSLYPQTMKMDAVNTAQYISSHPLPAGQGKFVELYMKGARRETALASQQVQESILSKATLNSGLKDLTPDSEARFKAGVASKLKQYGANATADDVIIKDDGKVTTRDWEERDNKMTTFSNGLKEAKLALKSKDPATVQKAQRLFKALGVDPSMPTPQAQQIIKYRVLSGE